MKLNFKSTFLLLMILTMCSSFYREISFANPGGFIIRKIEVTKIKETPSILGNKIFKKGNSGFKKALTPKKMKLMYQSELYKSFYDVLKIKGFDEYYIPRLFCIAKLESNLDPTATNTNRNKTFDVGLFQINSIWENVCHKKEYLYDTEKNIDCAKIIVSKNGLKPWVTYRKYGKICEDSLKI